jgi:hypothetical protein
MNIGTIATLGLRTRLWRLEERLRSRRQARQIAGLQEKCAAVLVANHTTRERLRVLERLLSSG